MFMTDSSDKKSRGRQRGWKKPSTMESRLPAMRIPSHLDDWLNAEADKRGLTTTDMARMLLLEIKADRTAKEVQDGSKK